MDDSEYPELVLYCEDEVTRVLIDRLLAISAYDNNQLRRISIAAVGPADTVRTLGRVGDAGALRQKCLGVLDGDQEPATGYVMLPGGQALERVAFTSLKDDDWEEVAKRLGVRPGDILDAKDDAMLLEKHHAWSRLIAERLGPRVRASRVWEAVAAIYAERTIEPSIRESFAASVFAKLSM